MAPPIRILVVDDAVVARRVISGILNDETDFEVIGTAPDGNLALRKIDLLHPDVVTLDIDMPKLDGLQTLQRIRSDHPETRVIMVSNHTRRGAAITVEALFLGASDYVTKAAGISSHEGATTYLREQLVPKIRALAAIGPGHRPRHTSPERKVHLPDKRMKTPVEAVVIGSSTGGPNALANILANLPPAFPVPVMIVQHLPENFTTFLAKRLDAACNLPVLEATDRTVVTPGRVWIAPGNLHLETHASSRGVELRTNDGPMVNSCRPAADRLFETASTCFGPGTLAVVLTGMGHDGLQGCRKIREVDGQIVVQDEATSVVWGMPGQVATAGLANAILPIEEVGGEIVRRVRMYRP
jgi:two-component system chemotaxis response regulator CheB